MAQVELAAPVTGVLAQQTSELFAKRDVVWFIDNSATLSCLVKGGGLLVQVTPGATRSQLHLLLCAT